MGSRSDHMVSALDYEMVGERAHALGLAGDRLTRALAALAAAAPDDPDRPALTRAAGVRLWELVVQREACGFADQSAVYQVWTVPPEVRMCMGPGSRAR